MDRVLCDSHRHLATSSLDRLATWFQSASGRRLLAEEAPLIAECARRFHGDNLLWAGCHTDLTDTVRGCMIRNRFHLETCAETPGLEGESARFRGDLTELPLPKHIMDAVVIHHVLETARDPRTAIREVSRVLTPGGRLLIVTFNPWSLWGIRSAYARFFQDSFSGLRFVSPRRLLDWLAVLGFELQQEVKYLAYDLPLPERYRDAGIWRRLRELCSRHGLPLGGVYLISAVKQVSAVRPDWSAAAVRGRKLAPAAYPKVSARILPLTDAPSKRVEDAG